MYMYSSRLVCSRLLSGSVFLVSVSSHSSLMWRETISVVQSCNNLSTYGCPHGLWPALCKKLLGIRQVSYQRYDACSYVQVDCDNCTRAVRLSGFRLPGSREKAALLGSSLPLGQYEAPCLLSASAIERVEAARMQKTGST